MLKTKTLWLLAGACAGIALIIGVWRYAAAERAAAELDALYAVYDEALALLEHDPGAHLLDTQRALRRAAVQADDGLLPTAEGYYLLGQQLVREVDYNGAEVLFRYAIDAAPDWSYPYAALGRLLTRNAVGRRAEAQGYLEVAIEIDPDYWDPWDSMAILHRLEGRMEEALKAAQTAVSLAPAQVGPHNNLANLLVSLERYEEAEREYRAAVALDDTNAKPYYNLACLFSIQGKKEEALVQLAAAIERMPALKVEAMDDPDLKPLRKDNRFKALTAQPAGG